MAVGKVIRGGLFLGVAVGIGAAIVAPTVWRVMRPAAKSALRAGIAGYGAARTAAARAGEEVEDLVAEVVYEAEEAEEMGEAEPVEEPVAATPRKPRAKSAASKTTAKKATRAAPKRKAARA